MKKTKFFNNLERKWVLIDAKDKVLGRISVRIAKILMGKHKPTYTPNFLCGDGVVVINAKQVRLTGLKAEQKTYRKYSGYHSGLKEIAYKELAAQNPESVLRMAVRGMLPKTRLAKRMLRTLKIYADDKHQQAGQQPVKVEV